jgi:hypothetical protein
MTKIILETADGEFVYAAELEFLEPPDAVDWNGRIFLLNEKSQGEDLAYTEIEPLELPYEMPPTRPVEPPEDESA